MGGSEPTSAPARLRAHANKIYTNNNQPLSGGEDDNSLSAKHQVFLRFSLICFLVTGIDTVPRGVSRYVRATLPAVAARSRTAQSECQIATMKPSTLLMTLRSDTETLWSLPRACLATFVRDQTQTAIALKVAAQTFLDCRDYPAQSNVRSESACVTSVRSRHRRSRRVRQTCVPQCRATLRKPATPPPAGASRSNSRERSQDETKTGSNVVKIFFVVAGCCMAFLARYASP